MSAPASSRLPLVFLHGWGLHGGLWGPVLEAMPERPSRAPDLPGYGDAPLVAPYDSGQLAAAVAGHAPPACVAVGWSMGGMAALAWAAACPQQVRALVLVGTSPVFVQRPDWPHGMARETLDDFARALAEDHRATLLRFLSLQARGGEAARTAIARLRASAFERGEPAPATLRAGLGLLEEVDLRPLADAIRCPVLIVHGGHDAICPVVGAEWLAGRLPRARLELQPGASHAPFLSHPQWFIARLRDFLDECGV